VAKKKKPVRPALWVARWRDVWMLDPVTLDPTTRRGRVQTFTVAVTQEEATLTMHDGLLWFDDIEEPGKLEEIKMLDVPVSEVAAAAGAMLQCRARFILPYHLLDNADKALIAWLMVKK